jgi:cytochrome c554/c'-like protein
LRATGGILTFLALVLFLPAPAAIAYTPPPLFRGTANIQPAEVCKTCHLDITEQWERSAHASADRNKNLLFGRMYLHSMKMTRGETMVKCGPCHETVPFVNQDFNGVRDVSAEGVACAYCHAVESAGDPGGIPPYTLDLAHYYGTIRTPVPTNSHGSAYSAYIKTSEYCGACHDYKNQHGVTISTTYAEWKRSKYGKQGVTCQSCHMPGGTGRNSYLGPMRPRVANHSFSPQLAGSGRPGKPVGFTLRGQKVGSGDSLRVFATVSNTGWGHSLPTGNDQKIVLIRIRVLTQGGSIVWENDPFTEWNTSIFGVILADELGTWPADTWTAQSVLSDRRIKAGQSAIVRYDVPVKDQKGPYKVEAQLLYRNARPNTVESYNLPEDVYGVERELADASIQVP